MRIKRHCNCPTEKLNQKSYDALLFEAMVTANQDGKDRSIVIHNGEVSHISKNAAVNGEFKIFANVPSGLKSIFDVEHLDKPF